VRLLLAHPELAKHGWLHDQASDVAQRAGDLAFAVTEAEAALAVAEPLDAGRLRARCTRLLGLEAEVARGAGEAARDSLAAKALAIVDRAPEDAEVLLAAGTLLLACGRPDLAWDVSSTTIDLDPTRGAPYARLAALYRGSQRGDDAVRLLRRAFDVEPTDPTPLLELAAALKESGDAAGATAALERIADQPWEERFASVAAEAKRQLGR
jgi:Flp pilus assembly protein TadD